MYNTHPHISTQEVRVSAKKAMSESHSIINTEQSHANQHRLAAVIKWCKLIWIINLMTS